MVREVAEDDRVTLVEKGRMMIDFGHLYGAVEAEVHPGGMSIYLMGEVYLWVPRRDPSKATIDICVSRSSQFVESVEFSSSKEANGFAKDIGVAVRRAGYLLEFAQRGGFVFT